MLLSERTLNLLFWGAKEVLGMYGGVGGKHVYTNLCCSMPKEEVWNLDAIAQKYHLQVPNILFNTQHCPSYLEQAIHVSLMFGLFSFELRKLIRSNTKACFRPNFWQTGQSTVEQSQSARFVLQWKFSFFKSLTDSITQNKISSNMTFELRSNSRSEIFHTFIEWLTYSSNVF